MAQSPHFHPRWSTLVGQEPSNLIHGLFPAPPGGRTPPAAPCPSPAPTSPLFLPPAPFSPTLQQSICGLQGCATLVRGHLLLGMCHHDCPGKAPGAVHNLHIGAGPTSGPQYPHPGLAPIFPPHIPRGGDFNPMTSPPPSPLSAVPIHPAGDTALYPVAQRDLFLLSHGQGTPRPTPTCVQRAPPHPDLPPDTPPRSYD